MYSERNGRWSPCTYYAPWESFCYAYHMTELNEPTTHLFVICFDTTVFAYAPRAPIKAIFILYSIIKL
jgi:hypothetical protein